MTTYYDGPDLHATVFEALRAAGRDVNNIDSDELAGMDEFHALGRAGTLALAKLANITPGQAVLDVGAGIGGPARALARHYGVHVTAVEPTERFASLARTLTGRAGLSYSVTVVHTDGSLLPFRDASFDLAWTQAVWQSVEDKRTLAHEIRRVLAPSGRLAMFETVGDGRELQFPVPWADGPQDSFLPTEAELKAVLQDGGLRVEKWLTGQQAQDALGSAAGDKELMTTGLPGIGLNLLMPDYAERMAGLARNVEHGRIGLLLAVLSPTGCQTSAVIDPPSADRSRHLWHS
ncbi:MAG: class I SAM-dependent methyltransferase [Solirubrobacterales bacterium]|nr:class I SAM-dependent methyltransferase [Solirubrobacterales bacterium]